MKGAVGSWRLEMTFYSAATDVIMDVYAPLNDTNVMSICRVSVLESGQLESSVTWIIGFLPLCFTFKVYFIYLYLFVWCPGDGMGCYGEETGTLTYPAINSTSYTDGDKNIATFELGSVINTRKYMCI